MPDIQQNPAPNDGASNSAGQGQPASNTQTTPNLDPLPQPTKRRVSKPKKQKVKQGHKLVWLTLLIVLVPMLVVGYVLLTSAKESDQPVEGNRFSISDLNPRIQESQIAAIQNDLMGIGGVEGATVDLKSATLRAHLNMVDSADYDILTAAAVQAYDIVNNYLPIETYFTNSADGKNYDLEIDVYNYLVDDTHPQDGWRVVKIFKSGAGERVVDTLTQPKNAELAQSVKNRSAQSPTSADPDPATSEESSEQPQEEEIYYTYYDTYYMDNYGNVYYY